MLAGGLLQKAKFILNQIGVEVSMSGSSDSPYIIGSKPPVEIGSGFETPVVHKQPRSSEDDNTTADIKQQINLLKLEIELVKIKSATKLFEGPSDKPHHMAIWHEGASAEGHRYYINHATGKYPTPHPWILNKILIDYNSLLT
jgi:hypothetical protein